MADDLSTYWKDLPSRETPLDAATLNAWGGLVEEQVDAAVDVRSDVEAVLTQAEAARDEVVAHADMLAAPAIQQVAQYVQGVGGPDVQAALFNALRSPVLTWLGRQSARGHQKDKLSSWWDAVAARGTSLAQIVVVGDSISEGSDAGPAVSRWQTVLQAQLRDRLGVRSGATFPFIPARPATSATGFPVVSAGTLVDETNWGLGWRSLRLMDGTSKVTFTFTGTSAAVMFASASGTGVAQIVIDGGAPVMFQTNSAALGGTSDALAWNTGSLTRGPHTIEVTRDASSTSPVFLQGALTFDGDETYGLRIIDAAHAGFRSAHLDATRTRTAARAAMATGGGPDLVIIAIGTNDTLYNTDAATYRANIQRQIDAFRTAGYAGSFLLIHWYRGQFSDTLWDTYHDVLASIAAADAKIALLDARWHMPNLPDPYTDISGLGLYAGNVHPNAAGHEWIAQTLTSMLVP